MKLFISYARVDKAFCVQIANHLDIHEIWYDDRLYAGQNWWKEILRRLEWCDIFIYLLSPDSVSSPYCRQEFEIARKLNKPIMPILIDKDAVIPEKLRDVQYADMSGGLTTDSIRILYNALYIVEREMRLDPDPGSGGGRLRTSEMALPVENPTTIIGRAAEAMDDGKFDQAVFLLKQARESGFKSPYIDIEALLKEAEIGLDEQTKKKAVELEYRTIAELIRRKRTRRLGCEAFMSFRRSYPNYDPYNLAPICEAEMFRDQQLPGIQTVPGAAKPEPRLPQGFALPLLEWREIPALANNGKSSGAFSISRYPITNAQYETFLRDPDGYRNPRWWNFSRQARDWRARNPRPRPPRYRGADLPRESVTWYEAVAFANWLGARLGCAVRLPTKRQWRRAAGADDNRIYPWGNQFDSRNCNSRESMLRRTTPVTRYQHSASIYDVCDMAGNIWEWCLDTVPGQEDGDTPADIAQRALLGGSFSTSHHNVKINYDFYLDPKYYYGTIGFRVVAL